MLDELLKFSANQAIRETTDSENIIDLGKDREIAAGNPVPLLIMVNEDFDNLTSLKVSVETSFDAGMSDAVELASSTVELTNLKVGKMIPISFMPVGNKRYVRLKYTVDGTNPSTGKVSAYLTDALPISHHNK